MEGRISSFFVDSNTSCSRFSAVYSRNLDFFKKNLLHTNPEDMIRDRFASQKRVKKGREREKERETSLSVASALRGEEEESGWTFHHRVVSTFSFFPNLPSGQREGVWTGFQSTSKFHAIRFVTNQVEEREGGGGGKGGRERE